MTALARLSNFKPQGEAGGWRLYWNVCTVSASRDVAERVSLTISGEDHELVAKHMCRADERLELSDAA